MYDEWPRVYPPEEDPAKQYKAALEDIKLADTLIHQQTFSSELYKVLKWRRSITEEVYVQRKILLDRFCQARNFSKENKVYRRDLSLLYVDEANKIVYCATPKSGSTLWKKVFLVLTDTEPKEKAFKTSFFQIHNGRYTNVLRGLHTYKPAEIRFILKTYFKFMFVRHPFHRLVSAFEDRFKYQNNPYYAHIKRLILYRYKRGLGIFDWLLGRNITFDEFGQYLTDSSLADGDNLAGFTTGKNDGHWADMDKICMPCLVNYDFIGHFEHFVNESNYLINKWGFSHKVQFPADRKGFGSGQTRSKAAKIFSSLNKTKPELISKLYDRHWWDFKMYNYTVADII